MNGTVVCLVGLSLACGGGGDTEVGNTARAVEAVQAQPAGDGEGRIVDAVTLSEEELAAQPPGQSEPGAASAPGGRSEPGGERPPQPAKLVEYRNSRYGFSFRHRANFRLGAVTAGKLAALDPRPEAAIVVRRRYEVEPPDLELRVYRAPRTESLRTWLRAHGLLPSGGSSRIEPFENANVSGLEVCGSTLIGPGCSYYVRKAGWIYQLTPASLAGERIVQTFATT